ncbi:hypothetical protein GCM10020255_062580 [Rhodococcus baikonurensis]
MLTMSVPIPVVSDGSVPTVVNLAVRTRDGLATVAIASLGRCECVRRRAVPVVDSLPTETDIVVIGAGPAGSSAAAWAARSGRDVVLVDAAVFPRDKTCGDGLTPRAVAELDLLGLGEWVRSHTTNKGLRLSGFGQELELEWPGTSFPPIGSAIRRTELDDAIRRCAVESGAVMVEGTKAVDVELDGDRVAAVVLAAPRDAAPFVVGR